jgi:hypothetical protein
VTDEVRKVELRSEPAARNYNITEIEMAGKTIHFPIPKRGENVPHIVSAAPLFTLLHRLHSELVACEARAPYSDLTTCLRSLVGDLSEALELARNASVYVTIDALAEIVSRPVSTLTRICRKHGAAVGAIKVEGAWSIHLPTFQEFLKCGDNSNLEEVA